MLINDPDLPLVSFVIPTHNRANLLSRCLNSVVNQTYANIEVIVVNDHSIDNTLDVLDKFSKEYKFLKFFNNEGTGGNAARNMGIRMSKGKYIAFMDDDDTCELFRIEEQMKPIINSNFQYNFVISGLTFNVDGDIKVLNYLKPIESIGFTVRWLIAKDIIMKAGLFDIDQPSLQDVEFFWRLRSFAKLYFSPISVVNVNTSLISVTKDNGKMIKGIKRLIQLHGSKMGIFEKKLWSIGLCYKCVIMNDWESFQDCYSNLNKKQIPITSAILFLSYIFKNGFLLKAQLRLVDKYMKFKSVPFKLNT